MNRHQVSPICAFVFLLAVAGATFAAAQTETTIHAFQSSNKYDGANAEGALIADGKGSLYGTTFFGGKYDAGTVFKLAPTGSGTWTQNIIYSFTGGADGAWPLGPLFLDPRNGKLYGTASAGGNASQQGVVFELTPGKPWIETPIYTFSGVNDGTSPESGVISDGKGTLYGTAPMGGFSQNGIVFRLSPQPGGTWKETILTDFGPGSSSGTNPYGGLVRDNAGALYGTTFFGGANGYGEVFKLSPPAGRGSWTLNVLYSFTGATDGAFPMAGLVFDRPGALYGTTENGGIASSQCCGVVFQLVPPAGGTGPWMENVLYTFSGGADGSTPAANLIFDSAGALYSTAEFGGDTSIPACSSTAPPNVNGCGVDFKLTPPAGGSGSWTESVLHAFTLGADGGLPTAALLLNGGTFYGTTDLGGGTRDVGTVFEITP